MEKSTVSHIVEFADLWGAPWAYSSFTTEDAGGFLKQLFFGSTHAAEQIFARFLARNQCRKFASFIFLTVKRKSKNFMNG